jgi:putative membrane protein
MLPKLFDFYNLTQIQVHLDNFKTAMFFSLAMALLNVFVKPVVSFFALPFTVLTLGLFMLIINALMVYIADFFIDRMFINGFVSALVFSILLSICTSVLSWILIKPNND